MKKVICSSLSVALATGLLIGCSGNTSGGGGAGGKVELTFSAWGNPAELKVYNRAVDAFNDMQDDIEVTLTGIPNDNYFQTLTTRLQGGQAPDIFYVGAEDISTLIENGTIEPLSDFLETEDSYVKADEFTDDIWGASRKDGTIYGLPVDCNPYLMYYNKTLLEEAGAKSPQEYYEEGNWNWEAFEEVTAKLRDYGKYGFVQEGGHPHLLNWIWTNGGEFATDDEVIGDTDPKVLEAFEFVHRMVEEGNFIFAGTLPEGQGMDAMFMSNQVGFVGAGRWLTPMFLETSIDFDYIPWPSNTENTLETANIATAYMAANSKSEHVEEAMKFISFYTSQEGQETRLDGEGNAVPSVTGIDEVVLNQEKPEHGQYLLDAREAGRVVSLEYTSPGLHRDLNDVYELMLLGDKTPEDALKEATEIAKAALEE
ncbi:sugar ABC transporter substrate-binding protein [Shouchella clausii]|uniref:Sugar ABC transporter substrate-binding protein n=1 Tax=Shouchella clausii TaxID=79880 RepID=A0A268S2I4_SHOCL|nr:MULTISPECIES: sugar ABC transporter substrate-binding protein [Shouchella]PAD44305.1 sugar ABC transporter substrate-binding protein [Bacillus sp. 7520-S]MCM3549227.1 sugar ABC transporter substrate-binding protein [Shouchella clausii]MCY1102972.1 sugar ABC transporter substrate-binding protein [Shouchella clausii]MEB5479419.1 sugar ABC transporter substrate-binding protein [Shouchella clausii]MED4159897.1 sugar ABC transporter substrate-binding protein [Shouchella clausii]